MNSPRNVFPFISLMLSYRLGTVNDFHWEFKPVSCRKVVLLHVLCLF